MRGVRRDGKRVGRRRGGDGVKHPECDREQGDLIVWDLQGA